MQNTSQNTPGVYRFAGLVAILGLLSLLVGLVLTILLPDIRLVAYVILLLGVVLLVIAIILDFRRVRGALTSKRGRFSTGTTVMASIFVGIILLANAISIGNYQRYDVTALGQFTLTTQTKAVLSKLKTPVQALGFFVPGDTMGSYTRNLLNEYAYHTDKLSTDFIDPEMQPDLARKYGIPEYGYGTVVFESQGHRRLVSSTEISAGVEHAFTSAILEVTGQVQKKVYFLTGHDEKNIASTDSGGYSSAIEGLRNDLYLIDTLTLITAGSIPQDCAVLVIAAPQKPLSGNETNIIDHYLRAGGQVLILADPNSPPAISQLISVWGLKLETGSVIDPTANLAPKKDIPAVTGDRDAFGLPVTYFPGAAAIIPTQAKDTIEEQNIQESMPLIWTTKSSWLEKDFDPNKEPSFNEGKDLKGPLSLGVIVAAAPTEGAGTKLMRLVVIGDSDFASNAHFHNGNNGDLFLNSVNWLAEETELIAIHRNVLPFRQLIVDPEIQTFIQYSSIGLLPLLILLMGGFIWWQRR